MKQRFCESRGTVPPILTLWEVRVDGTAVVSTSQMPTLTNPIR